MAASSMAQVSATLIQTRRDLGTGVESAVPGLPAATLAALAAANAANGTSTRVVWNEPSNANPGFSTNNGTPVIDASGNIYFVGTMAQTFYTDPDTLLQTFVTGSTSNFSPAGQSNNRGIFYVSAASGWANNAITMVARDGSTGSSATNTSGTGALLGGSNVPITGIGTNVLNGSSNGPGLAAGVTVSSNGKLLFNSLVAPVGGTTTGASFFTGPNTGFAAQGANNDALSGTTGATLSMGGSQVVNSLPMNNSGTFAFTATTTGGDTVTTGTQTNTTGIWLFGSGGNTKVMRRGDAAPGVTDGVNPATYAFGAASSSNSVRINAGGDVLFPGTLANTAATTPAGFSTATSQQSGVWYYKPSGGSSQLVAQSGTPVGAALPGVNFLNTNGVSTAPQMLNNSGTVLFNAKFNTSTASPNPSSAPITANVNDQGIMKWTPGGGMSAMFQTGVTAVPGVAGATTFRDFGFSNTQTHLNNLDHYCFAAAMTDGGSIVPTSAGVSGNDNGIWLGNGSAGMASLLVRAGDVAPGSGGLFFGNNFFGLMMNNADQIIFQNTVTDGLGHNGAATIFAYGPTFGIVNLFAQGNTTLLGSNYPLSASPASYNSGSNGNGGSLGLNDNGQFTFFANSSGIGGAFGANSALMVMQIPAPGAAGMALLGLAGMARRRRR